MPAEFIVSVTGLASPRPNGELADVAREVRVALRGLSRLLGDELDHARLKGEPLRVIARERRI